MNPINLEVREVLIAVRSMIKGVKKIWARFDLVLTTDTREDNVV